MNVKKGRNPVVLLRSFPTGEREVNPTIPGAVAIPSCCSGHFRQRKVGPSLLWDFKGSQSRRAAPVISDKLEGIDMMVFKHIMSQSRRAAPVISDEELVAFSREELSRRNPVVLLRSFPTLKASSTPLRSSQSQSRRAAPVISDHEKDSGRTRSGDEKSQSRRAAPVISDSRLCNPRWQSHLRPLRPLPPPEAVENSSLRFSPHSLHRAVNLLPFFSLSARPLPLFRFCILGLA
jgi:hypothetical protein